MDKPSGPQVIAVAVFKGGVGKTTSTGHIAVYLAEAGYRVLIVDLDHQHHITRWVLTPEAFHQLDQDILPVLVDGRPIAEAIVPTQWEGLDLAPSSANLAMLELSLAPMTRREERLKRALRDLHDRYDIVLIDCPPAGGLVNINALAASHWILVPVEAGNFAVAGLSDFLEWTETMREQEVHNAQFIGFLPTKIDDRTRISRDLVEILAQQDIPVLPAIPRRVGVEDLIASRQVATAKTSPDLYRAYHHTVDFILNAIRSPEAANA